MQDVAAISGTRIMAMRQVVVERHGQEALDRALATLPEDVRQEYARVTGMSWVRSTTDYAVMDALAAQLGQPADAFHLDVLRAAMERSFKTLWRIFLRFTSDEALIARTPAIYRRTRNVGQMTATLVAPGRAEIVLAEYPGFTARDARSIQAGLEVVLTLTGRRGVVMDHAVATDGARFNARWVP